MLHLQSQPARFYFCSVHSRRYSWVFVTVYGTLTSHPEHKHLIACWQVSLHLASILLYRPGMNNIKDTFITVGTGRGRRETNDTKDRRFDSITFDEERLFTQLTYVLLKQFNIIRVDRAYSPVLNMNTPFKLIPPCASSK